MSEEGGTDKKAAERVRMRIADIYIESSCLSGYEHLKGVDQDLQPAPAAATDLTCPNTDDAIFTTFGEVAVFHAHSLYRSEVISVFR